MVVCFAILESLQSIDCILYNHPFATFCTLQYDSVGACSESQAQKPTLHSVRSIIYDTRQSQQDNELHMDHVTATHRSLCCPISPQHHYDKSRCPFGGELGRRNLRSILFGALYDTRTSRRNAEHHMDHVTGTHESLGRSVLIDLMTTIRKQIIAFVQECTASAPDRAKIAPILKKQDDIFSCFHDQGRALYLIVTQIQYFNLQSLSHWYDISPAASNHNL